MRVLLVCLWFSSWHVAAFAQATDPCDGVFEPEKGEQVPASVKALTRTMSLLSLAEKACNAPRMDWATAFVPAIEGTGCSIESPSGRRYLETARMVGRTSLVEVASQGKPMTEQDRTAMKVAIQRTVDALGGCETLGEAHRAFVEENVKP